MKNLEITTPKLMEICPTYKRHHNKKIKIEQINKQYKAYITTSKRNNIE